MGIRKPVPIFFSAARGYLTRGFPVDSMNALPPPHTLVQGRFGA